MKQVVQGFGAALVISGLALLFFSLSDSESKSVRPAAEPEMNAEQMQEELTASGYVVMSEEAYEEELQQIIDEAADQEQQSEEASPEASAYTLEIKQGMTSNDAAEQLAEAGIIEDADAFQTYLNITGASETLQIGSFDVNDSMTYKQLADVLSNN